MIDIPGVGPVEAKGAASEATLKELLRVMSQRPGGGSGGGGSGGGSGGGGGAGTSKAQKNQDNANNETAKKSNVLGNMFGIAGKSAGLAAFGLGRLTQYTEKTGRGMIGLGESITNVVQTFANVGDSVENAASVFSKIPLVGTVFAAVAKAATATTDAFQKATASGATFGGSVTEFSRAASGAGMTMEKYGQLISQNGDAMRLLGGTTEQGANRFSQISKALRSSSSDLYALGYSTEDVNQGLANYSKFLGTTGKLGNMSNAELAKGAKSYLKEMDALAKVTGETRKQQEDAMAKLASDAQYQAAVNSMGAEEAKKFAQTINGLPPGLRDVAKDIMVTGTATTEESQQFMALMPKSAAKMAEFAEMSKKGIAPTVAQQQELQNLLKMEGAAQKKQFGDNARYNKDIAKSYNMMNDAANITKDGLVDATKATENAAKTTDGQAAAMEKTKQTLAEFSNGFQMALANSGILDVLMKSFSFLANLVTTFVVPAFKVVADLISTGLSAALDIVIPLFNEYLSPALQILTGAIITGVGYLQEFSSYLYDTFAPVFREIGAFIRDTLYPAFLDIVITIRDDIVPTLTTMWEVISTVVTPILRFLGNIIMDVVWPAFKEIAGFIKDNLSPIFHTLLAAVGTYVAFKIATMIPALIAMAAGFISMIPTILIIGAAGLVVAGTFLAIVAAVGAVAYGFKKLYDYIADLGFGFNMIGDAMSMLKIKFKEFMGGIGDLISKIPGMGRSDAEQKARDEEKKALEDEKKEIVTRLEEKQKNNATERQLEKDKKALEEKKLEGMDKQQKDEYLKQKQQQKRDDLEKSATDKAADLKKKGQGVIGNPQISKGGAGGGSKADEEKKTGDNAKETAKEIDLSSPTAALTSFAAQQKSPMFEEGKKRAEEEKARAKQMEEQAKMAGMSEQERAAYLKQKEIAQAKAAEEKAKAKTPPVADTKTAEEKAKAQTPPVANAQEGNKLAEISEQEKTIGSISRLGVAAGDAATSLGLAAGEVATSLRNVKDAAEKTKTQTAQAVASQSSPRNPKANDFLKVENPKKDIENAADKKAAEEKALAAATKATAQIDPRRTDNKPQPVQETAESLLASLNTKMEALISLSAKQADLNENQLSSLRGLSNDMYNVA